MGKIFKIILSGLLASLFTALFAWMLIAEIQVDKQLESQDRHAERKINETDCPIVVTRRQQQLLRNGLIPYTPCQMTRCVGKTWGSMRPSKCQKTQQVSMITAECPSRLGNQMFSYATLLAIAEANNKKAYISPSMSYYISKYFNISLDEVHPDLYSKKSMKWKGIVIGANIDPAIWNLSDPYIKLFGVPQVWEYFDELRPRILKEFQFYDFIADRSKAQLRKIKSLYFRNQEGDVTLIGVHVRRGDYLKYEASERFQMPSFEFYRGAMGYFSKLFTNVIFVVASNDVAWCEKHFTPKYNFGNDMQIHILKGQAEENGGMDLAMLAHCNHVIFGLGTFGWWAGYLSQGEVIYCADCITPQTSWLRDSLIYNGYYGNVVLPDWIGFSINGSQSSYLAKSISAYYGAESSDYDYSF